MTNKKRIKELYGEWNPNNILHDDNESVKLELEFIKIELLLKISNSLESISFGEERGDLTFNEHIQDINKNICEIKEYFCGVEGDDIHVDDINYLNKETTNE
jgi:hypothetical protein